MNDDAINIIATTINSYNNSFGYKCTFNINSTEKWVEAMKENKKLHERPFAGRTGKDGIAGKAIN